MEGPQGGGDHHRDTRGVLKQAEYIYNAIEGDKEVDTSPVGVASGLVRGEREGQALDLFTGIRDIVE